MLDKKHNDPMLEYFLYRWKKEIFNDLTNYPDHIRLLETFPNDQIMDFLDLLNSNIVAALLYKYNTKLLDYIKAEIEWEKLKVDAKELAKKKPEIRGTNPDTIVMDEVPDKKNKSPKKKKL